MADDRMLDMGLDIGSTTLKVVLLDRGEPVFERYRRHNADVRGELAALLGEIREGFPGALVRARVTGSGGLSVSEVLGLPFVQEVIAETEAVRRFHPETDVIIELGGEDAKITYLKPFPEQRMNGTCAGGTGAFIDQMATLLRTDASGLNDLAARHAHMYPIASRCGVFAKSDLQPLINEGAAREDLAASILRAVATQSIAGLACGRPIRGQVLFLGGPLHFLPELRQAFAEAFGDAVTRLTTPDRAQLYVALGAALLADGDPTDLGTVAARLVEGGPVRAETTRLAPLFADDSAREAFLSRHARVTVPRVDPAHASGPCFLGIDAGSTTIKAVVLNAQGEIVFSHYAGNDGDPVASAIRIVRRVHEELPPAVDLVRSCATGYGESLIRTALRLEDGEIETIAHYRAAELLCPGVTSVIDIGGQDMKYLRISNGVIESISVNEACSSGCGSFLQTFAAALGMDIDTFARAALDSTQPVDLGSRCTVFMNSSVKQAQKEGATVSDISAGLSYSVVRNALYKVIKLRDPAQLGPTVVVQGGTFHNDAVLRAFELLTGVDAVRPDIAGLMGAFGAAVIARSRYLDDDVIGVEPRPVQVGLSGPARGREPRGDQSHPLDASGGEESAAAPAAPGLLVVDRATGLLSPEELATLTVDTELSVCQLCQNHCRRTLSTFSSGQRHLSGNRCDRGGLDPEVGTGLPNLYEVKYRRLFGYRRRTVATAPRGVLGIPRALNMYENYPLWFTILSELGFRVVLSGRSSHQLFARGMDSIPSENVCYPAKLAHGHVMNLIDRGVEDIFYPCVTYEQPRVEQADDHFNCPIVTSYPELIRTNVEPLRTGAARLLNPFVTLANPAKLAQRLSQVLSPWGVTRGEADRAVAAGLAEDAAVRAYIQDQGARALRYLAETGTRGIVLAGRPYHVDPEVHHGIPDLITRLGMAVLTEDSLPDDGDLPRPLRVRDQWAYHSRLYGAAGAVAGRRNLELVQLNSFGCGLDAVTSDQVQEILEARDRVYTALKIDEVSNLGAARIRLRSLAAAVRERVERPGQEPTEPVPTERPLFTREKRDTHTLIAPQMSPVHFHLLEAALRRSGYQVRILEHASPEDVEVGLRYVNNDACYPAVMVIGQLVNAFLRGVVDPDACSVLISQTGGMCRATNYAALLRKALGEAGFTQVAVVAVSALGIERNPGFGFTPVMLHRMIQAVVLGDLLQALLLRVRPYEREPGSALALFRHWLAVVYEYLTGGGHCPTLGRRVGYRWLIDTVVAEFDVLPVRDVPRRPRVGIVGEILVKFHPDANNQVVDLVEAEGCEAVLPGLMEFVLESVPTAEWNYQNLGTEARARRVKRAFAWVVARYRQPVRQALARTGGRFTPPGRIEDMARRASQVLSLGNQAGEGWLLTAEMLELIDHGVTNIICAQPFACLPNHVTGRGMFREIQRRHPEANIVSIDYDPGASEVNQLNRIKLMVSTAHARAAEPAPERPSGAPLPGSGSGSVDGSDRGQAQDER